MQQQQPSLHEIPTHDIPRLRIIYNFITHAEERYLIEKVNAVGGGARGWKALNGRRSMYWGGTLHPSSGALIPAPFPNFMNDAWPNVLQRIGETGVFDSVDGKGKGKGGAPNHCLVNEYLPGQGILPHTDGPAYHPLVSTLSLGSYTILTLTPRPSSSASALSPSSESTIEVLLPARSLLVLEGELYAEWMHGIKEGMEVDSKDRLRGCANWESYLSSGSVDEGDGASIEKEGWKRGTRLSLTCRRVDKVRKGIKLG